MNKTFFFLTLVFILLFYTQPIHAQEANAFIRVSPILFDVRLSPGKTYTYTVNVKNLLPVPLPLRIKTERFTSPQEIEQINSLSTWIQIEHPDMIIPAQSDRSFTFQVQTPQKIPFGGYYSTISLEPLVPFQKKNENFLIQTKIAIPLLANIGTPQTVAQAKITNFTVQNIYNSEKNTYVNFEVKNNSLYHFSAKPYYEVQSLLGSPQKTVGTEKIILPGAVRSWSEQINIGRFPGIYRLRLLISVGNGNQITDERWVIAIPVVKTIIGIFTLATTLFLFRKRKKVKKAFHTLTTSY